jgi:YVTN family beta-propeller protein
LQLTFNGEKKPHMSRKKRRLLSAKSKGRQQLEGASMRRLWLRVCLAGLLSCVAVVWLGKQEARMDSVQTTIPAGTNPNRLAVNTVTNKIYVANLVSDNVTVINGADNTTATVTAGDGPTDIAVNTATNKIYAANNISNNVTVIHGADNTTATVTAGSGPADIAVNTVTNKIYVANATSDNVTVINGADNTTATVATGDSPTDIAVNTATNKIYIANNFSNNVTVINGADNTTATVAAVSQPIAIAVNTVTNKIYVANFGSNNLTVINGADNTTATIPTGTQPIAIAVNPVSNKIYVANSASNNVTVIDGANNTTATVTAGNQPQAIGVNSMSNKIYIANQGSGNVTVIKGADNSTQAVTAGALPQAIGVDTDTNRIYVANAGSNNVTVINGADSTSQSSIQFSASNYSVNEGAGSLTVTVTRTGDVSGAASVNYRTTDTDTFAVGCADTVNNQGAAFGRCDFATTLDTLTFAAGETTKTFNIPIIDDSFAEGKETFGVALSNVSGASLGPPSSTVTINDNDALTGPNPIFTTSFFVRLHYLDFLSREPEAGEPWTAVLNNCSDVNNNPACDRLTVSAAFFGSPEFQLKGYFVYRFYKLAFNRLPTYTEIVTDMRGVTGQTPAEVFQKKATFTNGFVLRTEFANIYGTMSKAQYVSALMGRYGLTQITTPDPAAPDGTNKVTLTTADLTNGTLTNAQILRAIADSDQVFNLEFNQAFVAMQYFGYLRRAPETAGFNAWLDYLNTHPTDSRTMVNGFMNSAEYRLRFGPQ